jgi:hypothetical protein
VSRYEATNGDYEAKTGQYTRLLSITAMAAYQAKSFEELRWEDYQRRAAGGQLGAAPVGGGLFVRLLSI